VFCVFGVIFFFFLVFKLFWIGHWWGLVLCMVGFNFWFLWV
jgi:hypothetical protein